MKTLKVWFQFFSGFHAVKLVQRAGFGCLSYFRRAGSAAVGFVQTIQALSTQNEALSLTDTPQATNTPTPTETSSPTKFAHCNRNADTHADPHRHKSSVRIRIHLHHEYALSLLSLLLLLVTF